MDYWGTRTALTETRDLFQIMIIADILWPSKWLQLRLVKGDTRRRINNGTRFEESNLYIQTIIGLLQKRIGQAKA